MNEIRLIHDNMDLRRQVSELEAKLARACALKGSLMTARDDIDKITELAIMHLETALTLTTEKRDWPLLASLLIAHDNLRKCIRPARTPPLTL